MNAFASQRPVVPGGRRRPAFDLPLRENRSPPGEALVGSASCRRPEGGFLLSTPGAKPAAARPEYRSATKQVLAEPLRTCALLGRSCRRQRLSKLPGKQADRCNSYSRDCKTRPDVPSGDALMAGRPAHPRPVRGDRQDPADRPAFAHRPAPADGPRRSTTSSATTTTPSWPTPPAWTRRCSTDVPPRERVRAILAHMDRFDNTVQYGWFLEIARTFLGFQGDRLTAGRRRRAVRRRRAHHRPARLGGAGPAPLQPGKGLPHQRLRRSADGLRHDALRPLPAHRRPGVPPRQAGGAAAAGAGDRRSRSATGAALRRAVRQAVRALHAPQGARACAILAAAGFASAPTPLAATSGTGVFTAA